MERNKDILYRVLNGEKMSILAREYLVSNTFISYTVHRQVKKVMPNLYGKAYPLMKEVISLKDEIIKKINEVETNKIKYITNVRSSTIRNAIAVLEQEGYKVIKES